MKRRKSNPSGLVWAIGLAAAGGIGFLVWKISEESESKIPDKKVADKDAVDAPSPGKPARLNAARVCAHARSLFEASGLTQDALADMEAQCIARMQAPEMRSSWSCILASTTLAELEECTAPVEDRLAAIEGERRNVEEKRILGSPEVTYAGKIEVNSNPKTSWDYTATVMPLSLQGALAGEKRWVALVAVGSPDRGPFVVSKEFAKITSAGPGAPPEIVELARELGTSNYRSG